MWKYWRNNTEQIQKKLVSIIVEIRYASCLKRLIPVIPKNDTAKESCPIRIWIIGIMIITGGIMTFCDDLYLRVMCIALLVVIFFLLSVIKPKRVLQREILDKYYTAYYYVKKNTYSNSISAIESQVAFMQSLIIPLFIFLATPLERIDYYLVGLKASDLKIAVYILLIILIICIPCRINKIYYLVWSDYEYLKRLEDKQKQKTPLEITIFL